MVWRRPNGASSSVGSVGSRYGSSLSGTGRWVPPYDPDRNDPRQGHQPQCHIGEDVVGRGLPRLTEFNEGNQ